MARRDQSKADYWQQMIRRQAGSGLSVRAWCGRHDVSEASFYWWRRRLARTNRPAKKSNRRDAAMPRFVPVRVAADLTGAADRQPGCIEIILSGTQRLRVLGAVNRQALADVLAVLHSGDAEPRNPAQAEAAAC